VPVPVDLHVVLLTALLNPVAVVVAFWMGASADQWQKLPLAAFAAAIAGTVAVYVAARLGMPGVAKMVRAIAGVLIAQFVFALVWACAGYRLARRAP
jgi:ABC-type Fe3+-siderophore transport system permease subunit